VKQLSGHRNETESSAMRASVGVSFFPGRRTLPTSA
jgi:hypothetical protein